MVDTDTFFTILYVMWMTFASSAWLPSTGPLAGNAVELTRFHTQYIELV